MKKRKKEILPHPGIAALLIFVIAQGVVFADKPGWQKEQADWQTGNGSRIKSISYPKEKPAPLSSRRHPQKPQKELIFPQATKRAAAQLKSTANTEAVFTNAIDSPAVDGFTPWIAISVTDAQTSDVLAPYDAIVEGAIVGNYLTSHPESDYTIGIFDTGSSAHVMGYEAGNRTGISAGLLTSNTSTISGVTGSVDAWVSQPLGIFIDGLRAIEPNGLLWDRSKMVGQSNVAIMVGQGGSPVDLPTAIGSPMSVYFTAAFNNDTIVRRTLDGNDYNSPDIHIYPQDDPCIPIYPNTIPMELRPLGASAVQYISLNIVDPFSTDPTGPSMIIGTSSQSVFFVASVDLYNGTHSAIDKTRFMLDTGAQVSVIGSRVASRLALNPAHPDFEVEIQGVTGEISTAPGFYISAIDIPALGEWLSFTNIPVVLLDVSSPEGGTLDGIIGMNLFTDLNFTVRGGGMFLQPDPAIEYEPISRLPGDINGDGVVDWLDVAAFADAWLTTTGAPNWNARADMVSDGIINFRDFAALAQNWPQ
jgi:predicted aspartyl protease